MPEVQQQQSLDIYGKKDWIYCDIQQNFILWRSDNVVEVQTLKREF